MARAEGKRVLLSRDVCSSHAGTRNDSSLDSRVDVSSVGGRVSPGRNRIQGLYSTRPSILRFLDGVGFGASIARFASIRLNIAQNGELATFWRDVWKQPARSFHQAVTGRPVAECRLKPDGPRHVQKLRG